MSCSSASVGFWPSDRMTVPSSLVVMVPSPSLSNKEKASLNSEIRQQRLYLVYASKQTYQSDPIMCMNSHLRSAPLLTGQPTNQREKRCWLLNRQKKGISGFNASLYTKKSPIVLPWDKNWTGNVTLVAWKGCKCIFRFSMWHPNKNTLYTVASDYRTLTNNPGLWLTVKREKLAVWVSRAC